MSVFNSLNASASALTSQRLRMDVVSANIANAQTTRASINEAGEFEPYRRKMVTMEPRNGSFQSFLNKASNTHGNEATGVRVRSIVNDQSPFKLMYQPQHPDANEEGYVQLPNVDPLKEMVDLMSTTRSYEANITSLNASKDMLLRALEIGK